MVSFFFSVYQSSSSSFLELPCIALCLARNASARPPAKLGVGVLRPLLLPLPLFEILIPESRGAGGGAGFRPATGRFAGGAGGVGLDRIAAPLVPFTFGCPGGGGGVGRVVTGGGVTSSR